MRPGDVDSSDQAAIIKAKEVCHRECYLSCMLLRGADNGRYYQFKVDLSNDMTNEINKYPKMMVETTRMLADYVPPPRLQCVHDLDGKGLAFVQGKGGVMRGPKTKKDLKCHHSASRISTSTTAMRNTTCSRPTMATGSFRSKQRECEASFPLPRVHRHMCELLEHSLSGTPLELEEAGVKRECPELKLMDAGVQNLNIDNCDMEHNLFLADNGCGLVQKQAKGV